MCLLHFKENVPLPVSVSHLFSSAPVVLATSMAGALVLALALAGVLFGSCSVDLALSIPSFCFRKLKLS